MSCVAQYHGSSTVIPLWNTNSSNVRPRKHREGVVKISQVWASTSNSFHLLQPQSLLCIKCIRLCIKCNAMYASKRPFKCVYDSLHWEHKDSYRHIVAGEASGILLCYTVDLSSLLPSPQQREYITREINADLDGKMTEYCRNDLSMRQYNFNLKKNLERVCSVYK